MLKALLGFIFGTAFGGIIGFIIGSLIIILDGNNTILTIARNHINKKGYQKYYWWSEEK